MASVSRMPFFMEIILLSVLIGIFLIQFIYLRYIAKSLIKKIEDKLLFPLPQNSQQVEFPLSNLNQVKNVRYTGFDKPIPNTVMKEDTDGIVFDENVPFDIPNDVKFEVEGGDSQVPPSFTEKTN